MVVSGYIGRFIALLISVGSKHILTLPSDFFTRTILETQSVGWVTLLIIFYWFNSFNLFFRGCYRGTAILRGAWTL